MQWDTRKGVVRKIKETSKLRQNISNTLLMSGYQGEGPMEDQRGWQKSG